MAFENVRRQAEKEASNGVPDGSPILRKLDARQRKALTLFEQSDSIVSADVARLFGLQPRSARDLCSKWCECKFIVPLSTARKNRRYALAPDYADLA